MRQLCTGNGGWSVLACAKCGEEVVCGSSEPGPLYAPKEVRRHMRAARTVQDSGGSPPFLRVELNSDELLCAGFSESQEFELTRVLDNLAPSFSHSVIGWSMRPMDHARSVCGALKSVTVVHVFGEALLSYVSQIRGAVFGFRGLRLAEGGLKQISQERVRVTLHCTGARNALANIKELLRSLPVGSRSIVSGDYPASLSLQGPEATMRQLVDDHVGDDAGMAGTARVLAARRTWDGGVLSCKSREDGAAPSVWKLIGSDPKKAFNKLSLDAFKCAEQATEGAEKWLGRMERTGVVAVLLKEDEDTLTPEWIRAEKLNRDPLPAALPQAGRPLRTTPRLTFEEKSKCLGVRFLQLRVLGSAEKSSLEQAMLELASGTLRFSVLRTWGGTRGSCELVRVRDLEIGVDK